jgi:hypothetical protein
VPQALEGRVFCPFFVPRNAGIGGVNISEYYRIPNLSIRLGNNQILASEIVVVLQDNMGGTFGYDCNLGLKSLMLFSKVRFNMVDFVLTTSK